MLLLTNILTTWAIAIYAGVVFGAITEETPTPQIWGLDLHQQDSLVLWLFLIGEISFILAIYVLGAEWWEKFRNIFVWKASEA